MILAKFFVLVLLWNFSEAQTNWCNIGGCGSTHIGCNNNGNFHATCVSPSQVAISADLKSQILEKHNSLRNRVALGQESRFQPARRMAQMVWNDDLAFLAELNTKQCRMAHDVCRNTNQFTYSGQNLGALGTSAAHYEPTNVIETVINMWYNENVYAAQSDMDILTRIYDSNNNAIGHFTAMVSERQTAIGCAISRYRSGVYNYSLMACNYASTNMLNQPVYRSGVAASGCTLGADAVFRGLCTTSEPIDPNSFA